MTVKELREKLARFDDGKNVVVYWENGNKQEFFEVEDLSMPSGTWKTVGGRRGFAFGREGSSHCVFISITQD